MPRRLNCPRCGGKEPWSIRRGKVRCSACRYEWTPGRLPLHLERREWLKLLHWFLRGLPARAIAQETGLHHQRVFRALTYVRRAMQKDVPEVFSGTVEVDETYLGGQWKNKRLSERKKGTLRSRGTRKTPAFGILFAGVEKSGHRLFLMWKQRHYCP